jgi:hypothetical protein
MRPPRPPEFLARRSYRLRRLMDAARLLPIFGLLLLLLPMLRADSDTAAPPTAMEGVYLFAVWGGLIVMAYVASLWLRKTLDQPAQPAQPAPPVDPSAPVAPPGPARSSSAAGEERQG